MYGLKMVAIVLAVVACMAVAGCENTKKAAEDLFAPAATPGTAAPAPPVVLPPPLPFPTDLKAAIGSTPAK